jgi:hypothetical protein
MPSDSRFDQALVAMARPIAEFRAILEGAVAQAEAYRAEQAAAEPERAARAAIQLGPFAEGRIDASRYAAIFPAVAPASSAALATLDRAIATLRSVVNQGNAAFVVDLPRGGRLGARVGDALAELGRAFGAVILVELIRGGRYQPGEHDRLLEPLDFHAWTKPERRYAPPLVVSLDGSDLQVGALADYSDGREKIVLVVRGAAPPAALARCITPGTLVLQTIDGTGLDRVAAFDGPGVAAVMPAGAAVFLHDPAGGRESWQRLTVLAGGDVPRSSIGGTSLWQMAQDRTLLADLARTPFAIPTDRGPAAPATGSAEAVDRLASWLLRQSGLAGS